MTTMITLLSSLLLLQAPADIVPPANAQPEQEIAIPEEEDAQLNPEGNEELFKSLVIDDLISQANDALIADRYPEALGLYTAASDRLPRDERLQYNLGVAAYRAGELETAARAFERAASSSNAQLTESALFNRGNVAYREALETVQAAQNQQREQAMQDGAPDPAALDAPIQALEQAIQHYRDAIGTAPGNRDARRNAELAHRLMKALEQEQEQQEEEQQQDQQQDQEQQDQEQQDQEQQDQQQQDQEQQDQQQQDQQQQDQEQQDQQQQDQQQQDQQQQDQEQQDQQQQDQQQQDQQQQDQQQQDQQQQDQQQQDQQQQDQQQQDQQQQDQQQQDQQQQDQQQQDQQQQDQQQQDQQQQDQQQQQQPKEGEGGQPVRMTKEQAEALLQLIRDKEKERREELADREARAAARRYRPVEKDW